MLMILLCDMSYHGGSHRNKLSACRWKSHAFDHPSLLKDLNSLLKLLDYVILVYRHFDINSPTFSIIDNHPLYVIYLFF